MKKTTFILTLLFATLLICFSCNSATDTSDTEERIENTLQSVSYFSDTTDLDPQVINEALTSVNEVISEIGYPDAGYKVWLIQPDSSNVRFMVEGHWPDQETYEKIHDNQLYKNAIEASEKAFSSLDWVDYHRFEKIK